MSVLAITHNYAQRVFVGECSYVEIDFSIKDAIPPPFIPKPYDESDIEVQRNQIDSTFNSEDLSSNVLVLTNSLRLLKMLVCKQTSFASFGMLCCIF